MRWDLSFRIISLRTTQGRVGQGVMEIERLKVERAADGLSKKNQRASQGSVEEGREPEETLTLK